VASCHQQKRLTWAELSAEADRVARGLWSLGIRRGDRVGLWSTNCIEWIMMHMGCARAGAALVNVNPAYRSHELQFTLQRSRMKALFLWHKDKRADYEEILGRARHGLTWSWNTPSTSTRRSGRRCWTPRAACPTTWPWTMWPISSTPAGRRGCPRA
jgi:acyl-CoA synthetase (AMP-forming)/AMP-acid ligase II